MHIVVHDSALGDFVLTWPILRALGQQAVATDTHTWTVTGWSKARLAARVLPGVEAVDGQHERWARLFAPGLDHLDSDLQAALADAHSIVSFVSRGDDAWAHAVRRLAPQAQIAFVPPRPPEEWTDHVARWHLACLADQDFVVDPVPASGRDEATSRAAEGGPIVIHPGSGGAMKRWPRAHFAQLVGALRESGHVVQPILGEVEWQQWGDVALRTWRDDLGAMVAPSLGALSKALQGARAYVGNDSGPTHLAAQLGVPTLALFGPTSPDRWAPSGPTVSVVAPESPRDMSWLDVDTVHRAVDALLAVEDLPAPAQP